MTVLSPLFLFAAALLGIPILLHLKRRRDRKTLPFPALRYLKRSTREHARIVRLRQILLLVVRLAAVALIVLSGARLVLPLSGADAPPAALAIVLDNGLGSGAVLGDARVLDALVETAGQVLESAGPQDRVWVVSAGSPWAASAPVPPAAAAAALSLAEPTHVSSDLSGAIARAESLVESAVEDLREIVVVSELRNASIGTPDPRPEADDIPVWIAPPPSVSLANRGIGEIRVAGGLVPRAGDLAEVQARVVGSDLAGTEVRVYIEDRLVGSTAAGDDGSVLLRLPRAAAGWTTGRIELDPDELRGDDAAYFAFQVIPPPVVDTPSAPGPYLREALSVLRDAGRITDPGSLQPNVQFLGSSSVAEPMDGAAIVIVPPDEPTLLPAVNQTLGELLPGWRLEPPEGDADTGTLGIDGGALEGLLPALSDVRVRFAYSIRREADVERSETELLTLSDGRPWALETTVSGRPVVVLASPFGSDASDLPGSSAMIPLVDALVARGPGVRVPGDIMTGEPIEGVPSGGSVVTPDGAAHPVGGTGRFGETGTTGIYEVRDESGDLTSLVAANTRPLDPVLLDPDEAAERLASAWPETRTAEPWPRVVLGSRRGREVAGPMVAALLLLLIAESWLAAANPRRIVGAVEEADERA